MLVEDKKSAKLTFDVDASMISIRKMLNKDFLELSLKAISSANPNRNGSYFTPESLKEAIPTFYNKPILGCFVDGDFVSHNGEMKDDKEFGIDYWDTTMPQGERILGLIRSEDKVELVDGDDGLKWIVLTCALWTKYSYKQAKRLIKDALRSKKSGKPTKFISVEVDVNDWTYLENGVMQINKFTLNGITILGSRKGIPVEPGIQGAELSVLDMMKSQSYEQQCNSLRLAYAKLEGREPQSMEDNSVNEETNIVSLSNELSSVAETCLMEETKPLKCDDDCECPECPGEEPEKEPELEPEHEPETEPEHKPEHEPEDHPEEIHEECKNFEWLCGKYGELCNSCKSSYEYYVDHCGEVKNGECLKNGIECLEKLCNTVYEKLCSFKDKCALDMSEEECGACLEELKCCDPLTYSKKCEELNCKYEELEKKCADLECKLAESQKLCEEQKGCIDEYKKAEFLSNAKSLIYSCNLSDEDSNKFYHSCEEGEFKTIQELKQAVALALFDSAHKTLDNTNGVLPVDSPVVFNKNSSAEGESKIKSSKDRLEDYIKNIK